MNTDLIFKKVTITLFIIVILLVSLSYFTKLSDNRMNDKIIEKYIHDITQEAEGIIKSKQARIDYLINRMQKYEKVIKQSQIEIEKLQKEKSKIQYVYLTKIKEINKYDAKQLEEYWQNEFK